MFHVAAAKAVFLFLAAMALFIRHRPNGVFMMRRPGIQMNNRPESELMDILPGSEIMDGPENEMMDRPENEIEYNLVSTVSGHGGSFTRGSNERSRYKTTNKNEVDYYQMLMENIHLKPFVPQYYGVIEENGKLKIELEELTYNLDYPLFIMDCKLGNRTYNPLESGLNDHKPQSLKMLQKYLPHLVKPEYSHNFSKKMFADIRTMESSSSSLCFRIDGIGVVMEKNAKPMALLNNDILWQARYQWQLVAALSIFTENRQKVISDFVFKLENIQNALWRSGVLKRHTLIGCSVLLIHDGRRTDVRLIDFAKALYSENDNIGTEEGIANIIKILKSMLIQ